MPVGHSTLKQLCSDLILASLRKDERFYKPRLPGLERDGVFDEANHLSDPPGRKGVRCGEGCSARREERLPARHRLKTAHLPRKDAVASDERGGFYVDDTVQGEPVF